MADKIKESITKTCSGTMSILANMIQLVSNPVNPRVAKNPYLELKGKCY